MNVFEMKDQLGQINRNLAVIEERVSPRMVARAATYLPGARLGSPDGWLEDFISKWVGPLTSLYKQLVEAGIITPAQAEKGLSKEELIALIKGIMEEEKPWYEQPWVPWVICGIAGVGSIAGATAYYLAKKPK